MLEQRVHDFLLPRTDTGDTLLVAVSGGPDSVALLHTVLAVADTLGVTVEAAHCDHGLRGADSDDDARFVEELARRLSLAFHHRAVDVSVLQADMGGSLEAVAREVRISFLEEARRVAGARWVLTGHTRDDQAETVLLNLFRGAGPRGLGAMLPEGPGALCRPFLDTEKREVLEYLESRSLDYRVDRSNLDPSFSRNRLRAEWVPLLQEWYGPSIQKTLAREAGLFAEVDDFLNERADELLETCLDPSEPDEVRLDLTKLTDTHPALLRAVLRRSLEDLLGDLHRLTFDHVDRLLDVIDAPAAGTVVVDLPRGVRARREYQQLVLGTGIVPLPSEARTTDVGSGGKAHWDRWRIRWAPTPPEMPESPPARYLEAFAAADLGTQLTLRGPQPGDRLAPNGMAGHTLVSDLLIDRKVPREARATILLLCDNGGPSGAERILWVVGQRRSRHAPLGGESAQVAYFQAETTK